MLIFDDQRIDSILKCLNFANLLVVASQNSPDGHPVLSERSRFVTYYSNLLNFFDQLANSRDTQSWFIDSAYEDDFRPQLLAQFGRLDSFLRQNGLDIDSTGLSFSQVPDVLLPIVDQMQPQSRELLLIVQTIALANEVLRKNSKSLLDANQLLQNEVHEFRRQLEQVNDDTEYQIDAAVQSLAAELKQEKGRNQSLERLLRSVRRHLKRPSASDKVIDRCLSLFSKSDVLEDSGFKALELELVRTTEDRDTPGSQNLKLRERVRAQRKAIKALTNSEAELTARLETIAAELADFHSSGSSLKSTVDALTRENATLRVRVTRQAELIELNEAGRARKILEIQAENQQCLGDKEIELTEAKQEIEAVRRECEDQKRSLRREMKSWVRKAKDDLESQVQRSEELRNHYEPIVTDLRSKLAETRASENGAQTELQKSEVVVRELRTDLAAARVDLNMVQLKLRATEEKLQRDQKLAEARYQMKLLQIEGGHQAALEVQQNEFQEKLHQFVVSFCDRFRDFLDVRVPTDNEAVQDVLNQVAEQVQVLAKRSVEFDQWMKEINEIRSLLGIDKAAPLAKNVLLLARDCRECGRMRQQIENDQKEDANLLMQTRSAAASEQNGQDWEQWAKRIHGLATDNFSTPKSPRELQFAIEEFIMGNLGQRQTRRKLEILRMENALLLRGVVKLQVIGKKTPSLLPVICIGVSMYRLRKLSGHLQTGLFSPLREGERLPLPTKHFPVVNVV
jgi:chromosome segregation ATPase